MTDHHVFTDNVPGAMTKQKFVEIFGSVYEHSSWIAEAVWELEPEPQHIAGRDTAAGLQRAFRHILDQAGQDAKLTLLRAHPDLVGKLAINEKLTTESGSEQVGAGLENCTENEFATFQDLNRRYKKKFGFPFIIAVRGHDRSEILNIFRQRVANDALAEYETALKQVHRIAFLRLSDIP